MKESFPLVTNEMDDVIKPEIVLAETDEMGWPAARAGNLKWKIKDAACAL